MEISDWQKEQERKFWYGGLGDEPEPPDTPVPLETHKLVMLDLSDKTGKKTVWYDMNQDLFEHAYTLWLEGYVWQGRQPTEQERTEFIEKYDREHNTRYSQPKDQGSFQQRFTIKHVL